MDCAYSTDERLIKKLPHRGPPALKRVRYIFRLSDVSQNHSPRADPPGSYLASLPIRDGAQMATYLTRSVKRRQSKHAIIVIHGSLRDADNYWSVMNATVMAQIQAGNPNVDPNVVIAAPLFYSTNLNKGEYTSSQLAWGDINVWQAGEQSNHPKGVSVSSYEVMDNLIRYFSDKSRFPQIQNITVAGHSGGAQVSARLAAVLPSLPNVHVRFLVGDPSSNVYYTHDRPITNTSMVDKAHCSLYNTWRYGFDKFDIKPYAGHEPTRYFRNYASRDVVNLAGLLDVENNGDQECMALLQGGTQRVQRNLAFWKYINLLGGTNLDVSGYPGNFSDVPNWKHHISGPFQPRLIVAGNWSHDVEVFGSDEGVSALFDTDLISGWHPGDSPLFPISSNITDTPVSSDAHSHLNSGTLAGHPLSMVTLCCIIWLGFLGYYSTLFSYL